MATDNYVLQTNNNDTLSRGMGISFDGQTWRYGVLFHGNRVVNVDLLNCIVTFDSCGYATKSTKNIINRFAEEIDAPFLVELKSGELIFQNIVRNSKQVLREPFKFALSGRQYRLFLKKAFARDLSLIQVVRA